MATYGERMQQLWDAYAAAGNPTPATTHDVAAWAVRKGLWRPRPADVVSRCAADLADALRQEYFVDGKGRTVRAMHAARIKERGQPLVLWADMRTAPRRHIEVALKQRRQQIVSDCRQLKIDTDSCNDSHPDEKPIQIVFDFTRDLEELGYQAA